MGIRAPLNIVLYDNSLSSPTKLEDITHRIERLGLTWQRPGGCGTAKWHISMSRSEAVVWQFSFITNRVVVYSGQTVIWEGRLEDIGLTDTGVELGAYGYWSACNDQIYHDYSIDSGSTDWSTGGPHLTSTVIKEMLTDKCPDISTDQSNIDDPDVDLVGLELRDDETPAKIIAGKLSLTSDTGNPFFFFISRDGRIPFYKERNPSSVDWMAERAYIVPGRNSFKRSWKDVINRAYGRYLAGGTRTRTATSNDTDSQDQFPIKERPIKLDYEVSAAGALAARDLALVQRAKPLQQASFVLQGFIRDKNADERPLWDVDAGDVIRIRDLLPASEGINTVSLNRQNTFWIRELRYDVDSNTMQVYPDTKPDRLDQMLARNGIAESVT